MSFYQVYKMNMLEKQLQEKKTPLQCNQNSMKATHSDKRLQSPPSNLERTDGRSVRRSVTITND